MSLGGLIVNFETRERNVCDFLGPVISNSFLYHRKCTWYNFNFQQGFNSEYIVHTNLALCILFDFLHINPSIIVYREYIVIRTIPRPHSLYIMTIILSFGPVGVFVAILAVPYISFSILHSTGCDYFNVHKLYEQYLNRNVFSVL